MIFGESTVNDIVSRGVGVICIGNIIYAAIKAQLLVAIESSCNRESSNSKMASHQQPTKMALRQQPTKSKKRRYPFRIGHWLPKDQKFVKQWLDELTTEVEARPRVALHPLVQEFKDTVEKDATLHMQYTQMFTEVTQSQTPTETPQVQNYDQMFLLVNYIMTLWAPRYNTYGLVGFPINVILNWSMGTTNGYAAFLNEKANAYWKKVLDQWGEFLMSERSRYVLVDKPWGWFGEGASAAMPNFAKEFVCDPSAPFYGFKSWDDFFHPEILTWRSSDRRRSERNRQRMRVPPLRSAIQCAIGGRVLDQRTEVLVATHA